MLSIHENNYSRCDSAGNTKDYEKDARKAHNRIFYAIFMSAMYANSTVVGYTEYEKFVSFVNNANLIDFSFEAHCVLSAY
jgi:hypothetical protein